MRKINILSKNVYNRIAAGEVIDRPYSAVKELVENSLDAGATDIEIYIEKGGKQLIKVADNGCGIENDDMRTAFLPHATSKISSAEDLEKITTLGFRGEALASISVISKVELTSVVAGNPAYKVCCEDGKTGDVVPAALEVGTVICVRDLFYNTPARAKFMKTDKKEEADISSFVARFILGNPEISFKFYVDGKLAMQSFGGGLDEAVAQVYGAKTLSQCFKINAEKDGIRLFGFIGNQNFFKPNKTYQSLFLNGRYIVNNTVATAVSQAYASYAMKRQYPFYVLFLTVPHDIVDVNVHPSKADVRFLDNRQIFGAVYSVISSVLDGTARAADFVIGGGKNAEVKSTFPYSDVINKGDVTKENSGNEDILRLIDKYKPKYRTDTQKTFTGAQTSILEKPKKEEKTENKNYFNPPADLTLDEFLSGNDKTFMSVTDASAPPDVNANRAAYEIESEYFARKQERIEFEKCKYKGNLFNTYLIYEKGDSVYIIDQHAAHERLLYDKLCKKIADRTVARQPLLFPYVFETNPTETRFLEDKLPVLRGMGFGIEPFGLDSFRIDEVPLDLQDINIKDFFDAVLSDLESYKDIKAEEILKDKLATTACKHAVKGGMNLTDDEADALFKMLDGNMGLKCPHGRPVCVTLTKREIEKMFKRIV